MLGWIRRVWEFCRIEFGGWKIVNCRFGRDIWLLGRVDSKVRG